MAHGIMGWPMESSHSTQYTIENIVMRKKPGKGVPGKKEKSLAADNQLHLYANFYKL